MASIYLLLSIGVGFSVHYCGGKVKSVDPMFASSNCCCDDSDIEMGCCDDEMYIFQLDDKHLAQSLSFEIETPTSLLTIPSLQLKGLVQHTEIINPELYDLPPPDPHPLYLRYGKLVLYG